MGLLLEAIGLHHPRNQVVVTAVLREVVAAAIEAVEAVRAVVRPTQVAQVPVRPEVRALLQEVAVAAAAEDVNCAENLFRKQNKQHFVL